MSDTEQQQDTSDLDHELLTEEERAALAEGDDEDESEMEAPDEEEAQDAAEEEPAPEPEEAPRADNGPDPRAQVSELDEKLQTFRDQRKEVLAAYDDGDMTSEELAAKLDEIDEAADKLKSQKAVAQHELDSDARQWSAACNAYLRKHPGLGADDAVMAAFDSAVRYVTGSIAYANLSYEDQLAQAHAQIEFEAAKTGLKVPPTAKSAPKAEPAPAKAAKEEPKSGADLRTPPQTLAKVSAADVSGTNDSPLHALQKLIERGNSDEIEAAMGRLTAEQRDEFASMDI